MDNVAKVGLLLANPSRKRDYEVPEATQQPLFATLKIGATSSEESTHGGVEPKLTGGGTTVALIVTTCFETFGSGLANQVSVIACGTITVSIKTVRFLPENSAVQTINILKSKVFYIEILNQCLNSTHCNNN